MPRHGQRPVQFACAKGGQCTAKSKRSGQRCRNYACKDRQTCRMHGGTSRRGRDHPNYKSGEYSKVFRKTIRDVNHLLRCPVSVRIAVYPESFDEWAGKKLEGLSKRKRYVAMVNFLDGQSGMPLHEQERVLRAARRKISARVRQIRDEIAGKPSEELEQKE